MVDFTVVLPETIKKFGITGRELQILTDGILTQTINIINLRQKDVSGLKAEDGVTLTLELRDIDDTGMSAPWVYEFVVSEDFQQTQPGTLGVKKPCRSKCSCNA
jgi:hypothetical protein